MPTRQLRPAVLWPLALVVGVALFFVTCLTEPAEHHTLNFGTEYGLMAEHPFALQNQNFPHRILGPLVAHVLGLAGDRYWLFAHGCTALLIAMIFATAMLHGARVLQALVLTAAIAFTGTIQIYKGHVGYPDPITWLLMLATILAVRRPGLFWTLQFVNLMNHEQIFFFWPWLLYWRHREPSARWRPDLVGGAVVFALYAAWRYYVGSHATAQKLTIGHYLGLDYFPIGTLGLASLNLVSTYIWFGLLPIVIAWHAFVDGWKRAGFGIVLFVVLLHAMFGVAHDVYRFTCFLFVPLLFAGLRLMQRPGGTALLAAIGATSAVAIKLQAPVFVMLAIEVMKHLPTPVTSIVPEVVPAYPGTFAAYGVALIATIAIGWLWARRDRLAGVAP